MGVDQRPAPTRPAQPAVVEESPKSFAIATMLCLFFGIFGIDRAYRGFIGLALLNLFTLGGFGIWNCIDLLMLLFDGGKDAEGRPLARYNEDKFITRVF